MSDGDARAAARAALAAQLLAAQGGDVRIETPSARDAGFTLDEAYAVADEVRRQRIARGESLRGYKIGFTNPSIWPRYGVFAPLWAPVWDTTLSLLDAAAAELKLQGLAQPRLEPEIVFGFRAAPRAGMDETAIAGCLEWVAHGFEIVQTHYEGWRFQAPDAVADGGLHGRLLVGPRVPAAAFNDPVKELTALRLDLWCDDRVVDRGTGAAVLGGPLTALRRWLETMAVQTPAWSIGAGDVVTTGTLTDAWPLVAGRRWQTRLDDRRFSGLTLQVGD